MSGYRTAKSAGVHEETGLCDKPPVCGHVVVIDPESADDIERLVGALGNQDWTLGPKGVADLTAALREFAAPTPPKPAEPTGLGAVVETADGGRWVRTTTSNRAGWVWTFAGKYAPYSNLGVVRVLSEGVTP